MELILAAIAIVIVLFGFLGFLLALKALRFGDDLVKLLTAGRRPDLAFFEALVPLLENGRVPEHNFFGLRFPERVVSGTLTGRQVSASTERTRPHLTRLTTQISFGGDFEIRRAGLLDTLGRIVGISAHSHLDKRLVVEGGQGVFGPSEGVQQAEVSEAVSVIFDEARATLIKGRGGKLHVLVPTAPRDLSPLFALKVLHALIAIAKARDHQAIEVRGEVVPGHGKGPRCPYCHGSVSDSDDLVACIACETLHHAECFEKHGHCTILGCSGDRGKKSSGVVRGKT